MWIKKIVHFCNIGHYNTVTQDVLALFLLKLCHNCKIILLVYYSIELLLLTIWLLNFSKDYSELHWTMLVEFFSLVSQFQVKIFLVKTKILFFNSFAFLIIQYNYSNNNELFILCALSLIYNQLRCIHLMQLVFHRAFNTRYKSSNNVLKITKRNKGKHYLLFQSIAFFKKIYLWF